MLLAMSLMPGLPHEEPQLCIVPSKVDAISLPVRISTLRPLQSCFYRSGPEEGFVVSQEPDGGLILDAITPGSFFLSPSTPNQPGFQVLRLKIYSTGQDDYKIFYDRDKKGWVEWSFRQFLR